MKLIVRKTGTIFDFCESSDGIEYDGIIYGGSSVKLSYTNDTLSVVVDGGETKKYDLTDLNYDDLSEIIGFASMLEFIDTLKTAGFTGNFNQGGSSSLPTNVEDALLGANNPSATNPFATIDDITIGTIDAVPTNGSTNAVSSNGVFDSIANASSTIKMLPADVTTTLATAQTITALTQSLEINSTYIIRGNLRNGCSGTGGVKFAITYPASTIAVVQSVGMLSSVNTASWNAHSNAISGVLQNAVSTFVGVTGTYNLQGTIKTGVTAGNLVFSFASTTSGQTSTIYTDGSYIEIIKVV